MYQRINPPCKRWDIQPNVINVELSRVTCFVQCHGRKRDNLTFLKLWLLVKQLRRSSMGASHCLGSFWPSLWKCTSTYHWHSCLNPQMRCEAVNLQPTWMPMSMKAGVHCCIIFGFQGHWYTDLFCIKCSIYLIPLFIIGEEDKDMYLCVHFLSVCSVQTFWGARVAICVTHEHGGNPMAWTIHLCLPGFALVGSWIPELGLGIM